jgi:hypothetical protein
MTFAEPFHPSITCPGFPDVACGAGEVIPLGQASEILVFGAGCGGACDLRTITLAGGSLMLEETVRDVRAQEVCVDPARSKSVAASSPISSSAARAFSKVQQER